VKLFITGGNGFVGSAVVRQLVAAGHEATCLLRAASDVRRLDGLPYSRAIGDVRDPASLRAAMPNCEATIHLAAPGGWAADRTGELERVIVGGTTNVLHVAETLPGHRVVFVSSTAAVNASRTPRIFDETTPFSLHDDRLHYAHAKHRAELAARAAFERGVPVVVVNPAEVYGPNDTSLGTAGNLIDFATSTPVFVCRGGTSIVHVDDVAAGVIAALFRGAAGERYILGGDNVSIKELASLVVELRHRRVAIVSVPNRLARAMTRWATALRLPLPYNPHVVPYATLYWYVDNAKARRDLGVSFRGARDAVSSTLDWLARTGRI
jgi:dihydroflavonol-4-reductase